jgi:DNA polymerase III subunit epsilon
MALEAGLTRWWPFGRRGAAAATPAAIAGERWAVLDVESTGLDAHRDQLIAVAALAVEVPPAGRPRLLAGDSFERVITPDETRAMDKPNILLHGIGLGAQRQGRPLAEVMQDLETWLAGAPVIGFHVAFDETLLQRGRRAAGLAPLRNPFIDLEHVAEALRPTVKARSLDEWMDVCGVRCEVRHQAAADAWATAEVLLHLWPQIQREAGLERAVRAEVLSRLARDRKWLTQQGR